MRAVWHDWAGGVFALFGGCTTVTAAVIANAVKGTSVPYLFPYAGAAALVNPTQPNVYSLLPLYNDQARSLVPYAVGRSRTVSVYAVTSEIPGYQADVDGVKAGTAAAAGQFIGSVLFKPAAIFAPAGPWASHVFPSNAIRWHPTGQLVPSTN